MLEKLKLIDDKYTELENKMASPEYYNDPSAITKLARSRRAAPMYGIRRVYEY